MAEITTASTTRTSGSSSSWAQTNDGYRLDIDDIAKIYVGTVTDRQRQPKPREAMTMDLSRRRELRRHLIQADL